jgi:hypothetical protein
MDSLTITELIKSAVKEAVAEERMKSYRLHYRCNFGEPSSKDFYFDGDIREADKRAAAHCRLFNYTYSGVTRVFSDLTLQEEKKEYFNGSAKK